MLTLSHRGLYSPAGNFHIDPSGAVENAVITHAHADHARRGSKVYYCTHSGVELLKARIGKNILVKSFAFREPFYLNGVQLSFHPAGHILGSSQVRIETGGQVWVASGDYKREPDPTCEPFEVVKCDVFVTEATFGTPGYSWPKNKNLGQDIFNWWTANERRGVNSVLFAYSLGKAQRVLGVLAALAHKPIYCHQAATPLNECYKAQGIKLAQTICLSEVSETTRLKGELILAPQAFLKSEQSQILGPRYETAFASGWMAQNSYGYNKGFVMSDHADWNDLVTTIRETGAKTVYVQHRGQGALVKHLRTLGLKAYPDLELKSQVPEQMALF